MRRGSTGYRRRRKTRPGSSVSLFPFLAVLLCTMGALLVLLVVVARNARLQAAEMAHVESDDQSEELKAEQEMVDWRIEQLRVVCGKESALMEGARLDLGHLEDHIRRLEKQLGDLEAAWRELQQFEAGDQVARSELEAALAQVRDEIAQAEAELAEARRQAGDQRGSYAVVFHHSRHETFRRPMYVECRESSVIIQPEGIELTVDDFQGPLDPGNPLAAALRAYREYLLAKHRFDPNQGEPYPLLLVRPEGIGAYYAAREALQSWGNEFGYQLIEQDWPLSFPEPDVMLAGVMNQAVTEARVRMKALAAAAPGGYGGPGGGRARIGRSGRPEYRAAPGRGGTIPADGSALDDLPLATGPSGYRREEPQRVFGRKFTLPDETPSRGEARGGETATGPSPTGSPSAAPAGTLPGTATAASPPAELAFPSPPSAAAAPDTPPNHGDVVRPGEWQPGMNDREKKSEEGSARVGSSVEPLADRRGRDWALPEGTRSSVPIARPIRIDCYTNCLVIVSGRSEPKLVPLPDSTEHEVEVFVSAVWDHMNTWGIAGQGMYWKPILQLHVAPGAEQRAAELETLLKDSGMVIERK